MRSILRACAAACKNAAGLPLTMQKHLDERQRRMFAAAEAKVLLTRLKAGEFCLLTRSQP